MKLSKNQMWAQGPRFWMTDHIPLRKMGPDESLSKLKIAIYLFLSSSHQDLIFGIFLHDFELQIEGVMVNQSSQPNR